MNSMRQPIGFSKACVVLHLPVTAVEGPCDPFVGVIGFWLRDNIFLPLTTENSCF
jgi:hypothetical protein